MDNRFHQIRVRPFGHSLEEIHSADFTSIRDLSSSDCRSTRDNGRQIG